MDEPNSSCIFHRSAQKFKAERHSSCFLGAERQKPALSVEWLTFFGC